MLAEVSPVSLIGPFGSAERGQPHMYARDVTSAAGQCVCKAHVGADVHTDLAPGLPMRALRDLVAADIRKSITADPVLPLAPGTQRQVVRQMAVVAKGGDEKRFLLGLAYQAGRDPRIRKGQDGGRDFFTPDELEKACWSFLPGGGQVGIAHLNGTLGHMTVTENYIYRGPDWPQPNGLVIKSGMAWLIGGICDLFAWQLAKEGKLNGFSPQGVARRLTAELA